MIEEPRKISYEQNRGFDEMFTCKILIKTTSSSLGLVPTKRAWVTAFATLSIVDAADSWRVSF